jgi:nucleoside-diphosphate-sugar epimerase
MGTPGQVIVTGATGLIGRALVDHLVADGTSVTALVRPGSDASALPPTTRRHELDLSAPFEPNDFPTGPVDAVVHLAQHSGYASFPAGAGSVASITVAAACRLAELAADRGASRMVFASSGGIYAPS